MQEYVKYPSVKDFYVYCCASFFVWSLGKLALRKVDEWGMFVK